MNVARLTDGARSVFVTGEDALWLGRMAVAETLPSRNEAEVRAVVSTIIRRWYLADVRTGRARTLTGMVRGYSTPMQDDAQPRYLEVQRLPWDALPELVRRVVEGVLSGRMPLSAPAAEHWAATTLYTGHGLDASTLAARVRTAPGAVTRRESARGNATASYVHVQGATRLDNVFSSTARSRSTPDPRLSVVNGAPHIGAAAAIVAGVVLGSIV